MHHGAHDFDLFREPGDRAVFVERLRQMESEYGVEVHGYALMPNHFHLLVRSSGRLALAMNRLCAPWARFLNERAGTSGPVFRGRYLAKLVEDADYWRHLFAYVHLNPLPWGDEKVWDPEWTSQVDIILHARWLHARETLAEFGGDRPFRQYVAEVRAGTREAPDCFDPDDLWSAPPVEQPNPPAVPDAPPREQVVWMMRQGWTRRRAALYVGVSPRTVTRWMRAIDDART